MLAGSLGPTCRDHPTPGSRRASHAQAVSRYPCDLKRISVGQDTEKIVLAARPTLCDSSPVICKVLVFKSAAERAEAGHTVERVNGALRIGCTRILPLRSLPSFVDVIAEMDLTLL